MTLRFLTITCFFLFLGSNLVAQKKDHKNFYKKVNPIEKENFVVDFKNMVSHQDYCKFGYSVDNQSEDFIVVNWSKSAIIINGTEYKDTKKEQIIKPGKSKSGTYNVAGETNYHVDAFSFKLDGISVIPADGTTSEAPNFKLPASTKEISFGDFKVKMKKVKKETKETEANFEVVYTGNDYAIINTSKIGITVPNKGADEFANDGKGKVILLNKGEKCQIKLVFHISAKYSDMQFANMEIVWRDAFKTSVAKDVDQSLVEFNLDPGLTEGKN